MINTLTLSSSPVGPHIGRYCGQTSPGRVTSYTGILSMTITTDSAIAKEGFSASYTIRERSLPLDDEGESPGSGGVLSSFTLIHKHKHRLRLHLSVSQTAKQHQLQRLCRPSTSAGRTARIVLQGRRAGGSDS